MENSELIQEMAQDVRAEERHPYHDCISIGQNQGDTVGWFNTFAQLGQADELYLFNQRSRASVGLAYCNLDSPSLFDVGYKMSSIGVQFEVPPIQNTQEAANLLEFYPNNVFQELLEDCSLQFFLNQDEKIAGNCSHFPAGFGAFGGGNPIQGGYASLTPLFGTGGQYTNGAPEFGNQWKFESPIEIPRNHTVYAILKFSDFARDTLQKMSGPGWSVIQSGGISGPGAIPVKVQLRVTINGTRLVQLRNAQTYR